MLLTISLAIESAHVQDDGPGPELSRRLGYLFKHARCGWTSSTRRRWRRSASTRASSAILLVIAGHEPGSQQQAAQRLGIDRTTMVALLDALEGQGPGRPAIRTPRTGAATWSS